MSISQSMQREKYIENILEKYKTVFYVVLLTLLVVFLVSTHVFLMGPEERITQLTMTHLGEGVISPAENVTVSLVPYENRLLLEYHVSKLHTLLLSRTVNIRLKTHGGGTRLYMMNKTQLENFNEDNSTSNEVFVRLVENAEITYFPDKHWSSYYIVLFNENDQDITIEYEIVDQYDIIVLDYRLPFTFLKLAFISATSLLLLQIPLELTIDDIMDGLKVRIRLRACRTPPALKRGGVRGVPSFHVIGLILGCTVVFTCIYLSYHIDRFAMFVGDIWKDGVYRMGLAFFIFVMLLLIFLRVILVTCDLIKNPQLYKHFFEEEKFLMYEQASVRILKKFLIGPASVAFYICLSFIMYIQYVMELDLVYSLCINCFLLYVYVGVLFSFICLKMQRVFSVSIENLLKYAKVDLGSYAILSIFAYCGLKLILPNVYAVTSYIVDGSILVSISGMEELSAHTLFSDFEYIIPYISYGISIGLVIIYYTSAFTIVFLMPKFFRNISISESTKKDLKHELVFLIMTFSVVELGFELMVHSISLKDLLILLSLSFVASMFSSYLETWKHREECTHQL